MKGTSSYWVLGLLAVTFLAVHSDVALAASSESLVSQGTGIGGTFDKDFETIAKAFVAIAKVVVVIMTCVALGMVMWGVEDGKKTMWNWILGAGLAVNIGSFLLSVFTMPDVSSSGAAVTPFVPDLKSSNDGKISVLGDFMSTYQQVINHGASVITPICIRILLILTVIEASWELSFKLISGDKIKYLLSLSIKVGFIIFLLENWVGGMGLMTALSQGFETMGLMAGGTTADVSPDNIVNNAVKIFSVFWDKAHFNSLGLLVVNCVSLLTMIVLLFLTAIEMFMARVEFYTMAMLVMPLLPFMITSKFSFLSDKAIGAMFNLAIKIMAIAFMTTIIEPFLNGFAQKVAGTKDAWEQVGIIFQVLLCALILYILVRKISELASGLLNGQPSLGGGSMTSTMRGAVGGAAAAAGNVRGAAALAKAAGHSGAGGLTVGTLAQIGKAAMRSNPAVRGYRAGMRNIQRKNQTETSSKIVQDITNPRTRTDGTSGVDKK